MKSLLLTLLFISTTSLASTPGLSGASAQKAHSIGLCGSLAPGTGLKDGEGWVVSMLPGKHEFRVRGGGVAYLTVAKMKTMDFDAGRPYYIVIEGAKQGSVLEWKTPATGWEAIPTYFLYPPQGATYKK